MVVFMWQSWLFLWLNRVYSLVLSLTNKLIEIRQNNKFDVYEVWLKAWFWRKVSFCFQKLRRNYGIIKGNKTRQGNEKLKVILFVMVLYNYNDKCLIISLFYFCRMSEDEAWHAAKRLYESTKGKQKRVNREYPYDVSFEGNMWILLPSHDLSLGNTCSKISVLNLIKYSEALVRIYERQTKTSQ